MRAGVDCETYPLGASLPNTRVRLISIFNHSYSRVLDTHQLSDGEIREELGRVSEADIHYSSFDGPRLRKWFKPAKINDTYVRRRLELCGRKGAADLYSTCLSKGVYYNQPLATKHVLQQADYSAELPPIASAYCLDDARGAHEAALEPWQLPHSNYIVQLENDISPIFHDIALNGIMVDVPRAKEYQRIYRQNIAKHQRAGELAKVENDKKVRDYIGNLLLYTGADSIAHPEYDTVGPSGTGRVRVYNPNFAQSDTEIRDIWRDTRGVMFSLDIHNSHARVAAALSGDKQLAADIERDLHSINGDLAVREGYLAADKADKRRQWLKIGFFAYINGVSSPTLSDNLGSEELQSGRLLYYFGERYPALDDLIYSPELPTNIFGKVLFRPTIQQQRMGLWMTGENIIIKSILREIVRTLGHICVITGFQHDEIVGYTWNPSLFIRLVPELVEDITSKIGVRIPREKVCAAVYGSDEKIGLLVRTLADKENKTFLDRNFI